MAETIIPQTRELNGEMIFSTVGAFYTLRPEVTDSDIESQISAKQMHLKAMLDVGGDYAGCDGGVLSSYFWACNMAAQEIEGLTGELIRRHKSKLAAHHDE